MLPSSSSPAATLSTRPSVLWAIGLVALAHVGYLALLIACDLLRIGPLGFVARFEPTSMIVGDVEAGSSAAAAGLRVGDRVAHANGQVVGGRMDWQRVRVDLDPAVPLDLRVERDGRP